MATWPAQLPQKWPLGARCEPKDSRLRFDGLGGPSRLYREFTAEEIVWRIPPMTISEAQRTVLETFWNTTLPAATPSAFVFDWADPYEGAGTKSFRFVSRPTYTFDTPRIEVPTEYRAGSANPLALLTVLLELEELPWYPA